MGNPSIKCWAASFGKFPNWLGAAVYMWLSSLHRCSMLRTLSLYLTRAFFNCSLVSAIILKSFLVRRSANVECNLPIYVSCGSSSFSLRKVMILSSFRMARTREQGSVIFNKFCNNASRTSGFCFNFSTSFSLSAAHSFILLISNSLRSSSSWWSLFNCSWIACWR